MIINEKRKNKLYIVFGRKPLGVGGFSLFYPFYKPLDECEPHENVHYICESKEMINSIKTSYIKITNIYEIDATLITKEYEENCQQEKELK